jgi:hypothetical protein
MDLGELEQDVKLYRTSPELLGDFKKSLEPFLWKISKSGKRLIRSRVRIRDTDRLVALVRKPPLPLCPLSLKNSVVDSGIAGTSSRQPPTPRSPSQRLHTEAARRVHCLPPIQACQNRSGAPPEAADTAFEGHLQTALHPLQDQRGEDYRAIPKHRYRAHRVITVRARE